MAIGNQSQFDVSDQDLENPAGLARLGFKFISTVSSDGDRALAGTILDSYNEHELIAALSAAAGFMAHTAAESEGIPVQELLSRLSAMVPDASA